MNPRRRTVAGPPCFPGPAAFPGRADLAILAIGAEAIVDVVRQWAEAGIGSGIVWAGGFAEIGALSRTAAGAGRGMRQDRLQSLRSELHRRHQHAPGHDGQLRVLAARDGRAGAAVGFVTRFSRLAVAVPWRRFVLEANPIRVREGEAVAVDGLLVVEEP